MSAPPVSACMRSRSLPLGVDPDNVLVVRVTEAGIEGDALDFDYSGWPVKDAAPGSQGLSQRGMT